MACENKQNYSNWSPGLLTVNTNKVKSSPSKFLCNIKNLISPFLVAISDDFDIQLYENTINVYYTSYNLL